MINKRAKKDEILPKKVDQKFWTLDFGLETFVGLLLLLLFKHLDQKNQTLGFHFFWGIYFPSNSNKEKGGLFFSLWAFLNIYIFKKYLNYYIYNIYFI
jgi:hypothetical protein